MEEYLEDAVESVRNHLFTEESVVSNGRTMFLALAGMVWALTLKRQPADVKHALQAHLAQGFDRSMLASKLQARRTKQGVNEWLQIDSIRDEIRSATDKAERLRLSNALRKRVLTGMLAGAYLHALTIGLFCIKNTIRVLFFVLHQREQKRHKGGLLSTWWRVGFKGLLMQRLAGVVGSDGGSPFVNDQIDENAAVGVAGGQAMGGMGMMPPLPPFMDPMMMMIGGGEGAGWTNAVTTSAEQHQHHSSSSSSQQSRQAVSPVSPAMQPWVAAAAGGSTVELIASLERAFSVKECIEAAIPRVLADAEAVVAGVFDEDPALEKKMAPTAAMSQADLETVFDRLVTRMDRQAAISQWIHHTPPLSSSTSLSNNNNNNRSSAAQPHQQQFQQPEEQPLSSPSEMPDASTTLPPSAMPPPPIVVEEERANGVEEDEGEEGIPASVSARPSADREIDNDNGGDRREEDDEGERVQFTQLAELRHQKMANAAAAAAVAAERSFNTTTSDAGDTATLLSSTTDAGETGEPVSSASHRRHRRPMSALPGTTEAPAHHARGEESNLPIPPPPPLPLPPITTTSILMEGGGANHNNTNTNTNNINGGNPLDFLMKDGNMSGNEMMTMNDEAMNAEAAQQLLQTAESFQHVIHTVSFGELVLADSRRVLRSITGDAAKAFPELRKYDAERGTAPVIMVVTKLEELRQRLADETFEVPSYLALFCTELVRGTCQS